MSIIPTGLGAAGYTMPLPERDEMFNTKGRMLQDIMVSLGGRIAEEIIFDDVTTALLFRTDAYFDKGPLDVILLNKRTVLFCCLDR